jgi:hypothetical protein
MILLGVREGNLYRMRVYPMHDVTSWSREIDEEERLAPLVVRKVAPPVA